MSKKLVAYFSASGSTREAAKKIAGLLNCDTYEIKPKTNYTTKDLNYNDPSSRTSIECKNKSFRTELADKDANIANYDTILIGFPIWWYLPPSIILTFLESYDFTGKKLVIWGTSMQSHIGETMIEIKNVVKGANVVEGKIFDIKNRKDTDYQKFIEGL